VPAIAVDDGASAFGHDAWQVFQQAATGDVGEGVYIGFCQQGQQCFDVDACRGQQGFTEGLAVEVFGEIGVTDFDDFANQ